MPVIVKPSDYFNVVTYTGTGSSQTISVGFQPDFVWIKSRSNAQDHKLTDAVRGVTKSLESNTTDVEATDTNGITAFTSTGFTVGSDSTYNTNAYTYVAWCWKANGAGSTNTAGSITSTVSANTTAGFSIVTYTGTGSAATVGHGLGVTPTFIIIKKRSASDTWNVYSVAGGVTGNTILQLNTTDGSVTGSNINITANSTTIGFGSASQVNGSGATFVCYAFAPVAGYSAFGSYTGNGSDNGVFIYTGFRPRFLMIKRTNSASGVGWWIYDSVTSTYNYARQALNPNLSGAEQFPLNEGGGGAMDILSNGFKCRGSYEDINASGSTYIYMAFAESPFKYANAR